MPRSTLHPPESEAPTQIMRTGPSPIPAMYFFAVLFPIVGVILGIRRFYKQDLGNGFGLLVASLLAFALWISLLAMAAPAQAGWKLDRAQDIAQIVWHDPCNGDVTIRWASIDAAATTEADEGRPEDDEAGCVTTLDTKGPGGTSDPWTWDYICTYVIHEYGHLARFMDWSNAEDPNHSSNPLSVMYFAPSIDRRCRRHGLPYLRAHDNNH